MDSKTGRDLVELMRSLNERFDTTFVISSHDPAVIDAAGRLVQIEDGRIVGSGVVYKPKKPIARVCPNIHRPLSERVRVYVKNWWR